MAYYNMKTNKAHVKQVHSGLYIKRNLKRQNAKIRKEVEKQNLQNPVNYGFWHNILVLIKYIYQQWKQKKTLKLGL